MSPRNKNAAGSAGRQGEGQAVWKSPQQHFGAYLGYVLAGAAAALVLFCFFLAALSATANLPPPAFTNSLCIDEKLEFLRNKRPRSPDLLVMGSSVAWRHFDGAAVAAPPLKLNPLNGGFCGLHANQSIHAAGWLLDHEPTIRQVIMIASPQDFAECSQKSTAVFNDKDATRFVYDGASRWPYYLKYFSPLSLIGNARRVKDKRANLIELDPLVFDRYGGGPLDTGQSRPTLYYDSPAPLDPACFQSLQNFALRLQAEKRTFMVVSTPLHPEWKAREDPQGVFLADFDRQIKSALAASAARYWDADSEWVTGASGFTDAIHLRWSAAQEFSAALALKIGPPR